jgi:hypothetical protein
MKDFNFFEPYQNAKKASKLKGVYITLCVIVFLSSYIGLYKWNDSRIEQAKKQVAEVEKKFDVKKYDKLDNKRVSIEKRYNLLKEYYENLQGVEESIYSKDVIGNDILDRIGSTIPKNVYIFAMSLSEKNIQIQGSADTRITAAEFVHNLKSLEIFEKVYIPGINELNGDENDEKEYSFSVICTLKDGKKNEEE